MASRHTRIVDRAITRLKLKQLRLLVAVGEFGSIQHAARELRMSQPAAQELDELTEGSSGRVVIGALLAAAPILLPRAIEIIMAERPKVAIKVIEGTSDALMPALFSGEIDMIVGRLPAYRARPKLVQETLFDERIVAVVGNRHPLAGKKSVSFRQLRPYGWILPPPETTLRRQIDQFFVSQKQYAPQQVLESVSYVANRALLQKTDLVGVMPEHVVAHDFDEGLLVEVNWKPPFGHGPVGVSYRGPDSLSPAGTEFLNALRRAARAMDAD